MPNDTALFPGLKSSVRVKYILNATRGKFDYDLLSLLTVDDVQEKVQYHSACITNYLLKWIAFKSLAARRASATDIELLKTIFD
jgi:hypothetical protein